jgi:hypothetical protein
MGDAAMTGAERQKRRRDKAKTLRDAAHKPIQSAPANPSPVKEPGTDYPRMLYHADGRTIIAETPEQQDPLIADGWSTIPSPIHQQRPVTHHGFLGASSDPLATIIREVLTQVLDERDLSGALHGVVEKG